MTPELPPIRTFTARELCDIALLAAGMKDIHAIAVDGKATLARLAEALDGTEA